MDLMEMTIQQYHQALSQGTMTTRELVAFYLDRIKAFDQQGPMLNAIIMTNPNALNEADLLDAD